MYRYFAMVDELNADPRMETIFRLTFRKPGNIFAEYLNDAGRLVRVTYAQLRASVDAFAGALDALLPPAASGGFIGLKLKNSPDWCAAFWACLMTGRKPVIIDASAPRETTAHILAQAGARAMLCPNGDVGYDGVSCVSLDDVKRVTGRRAEPRWTDEVAFCSSGTTGDINVFVFGERELTAQIASARIMPEYTSDIMYPDEQARLKNIALLPFHHIFGFVAVFLWYTFFNKTIVFVRELEPKHVLNTCRKLRVTHIYCVPMFWNGVDTTLRRQAAQRGKVGRVLATLVRASEHITLPDYARYRLRGRYVEAVRSRIFGSSVRYCISGGSYLPQSTLALMNALNYPLYNGYGLTEAGITSVELSPDVSERMLCSIGIPLYGVKYAISPTNGDENYGELLISSPQLARGRMVAGGFVPLALEDGWLRTGDIARRIDGRYYVSGRQKDLIITDSGENLSPDELEVPFMGVKNIAALCILGADDGSGELVTMVVELSPNLTQEDVMALRRDIIEINQALPPARMLRRLIVALDPIPRTGTRKIRRGALKAAVESGSMRSVSLALYDDDSASAFRNYTVPPAVTERIRRIFATTLSLPVSDIADTSHFIHDLDGDSLYYASLTAAIEDEFGVKVPPELYGVCMTVRDFGQYVMYTRAGKQNAKM